MVAERAGVGSASVSRVLSGHPDVSDKMRTAVLQAAKDCGYEVDLLARALRSGSSRTIGILIGDILNPFLAEIIAGAAARLRADGYAVILATSDGDDDSDTESVRVLLQRRVDGLILSVSDENSTGLASVLERAERPVVLLDREIAVPGVGQVLTDHRRGMDQVIDHLVGLGHTDIGLVVGPLGVRPSRERRTGFVDALRARGLPVTDEWLIDGPFTTEFGYDATRRVLAAPRRPTALVCGGNQFTTGALIALEELGVQIPQELSLVGCDDVPITRLYRPHITVLARDAYAMGEGAAAAVLDGVDNPDADPVHTVLEPQLVLRDSTASLSRGDL